MFTGFQIGNLNYIKILITDPNLEGHILVEEMSYSLNSENYFYVRPIVPRKMFNHHYFKSWIIVGFSVESVVE
jgi:hypothetical protein